MENTDRTTPRAGKLASHHLSHVFVGLILMVVGFGTTGCDGLPARVPVSGKVTVGGEALKCGSITFYATAGGRPGGATLAEDGSYSVTMYKPDDGLPPGTYTVTVAAADWVSDKACRWHAPKRYQNAKTSGLVAEIGGEATTLDFDLTWEGDPHKKPWVEKF